MSLKNLFLKISDQDFDAAQDCISKLDEARIAVANAAHTLGSIPGMNNEAAKLRRSADALRWERDAVENRLAEIDRRGGKRAAV